MAPWTTATTSISVYFGLGRAARGLAPGSRPGPERVEVAEAATASGDGDRLVAIHDHLRQELAQVRDVNMFPRLVRAPILR